ncbi:hypothetical protein BM1_10126 [Bipolaris maydis]|nr:hypothetical protein BM1_10126 [Bipolaris maydis]
MLAAALLAPVTLAIFESLMDAPTHSPRYDYIIVGGGTFSLVVADRLSEDFNVTVALIEAGDIELDNTNITSTSKYGNSFGTAIDWYDINGMTYLRAEAAQIDLWEQFGNEGWSWEDLMPYYKKSEYIQEPTRSQMLRRASFDPKRHGTSRPLAVGWTEDMLNQETVSSISQTFEALGLPFNKEPNAGSMRGFTVFPKTIDRTNNVREDAGRLYYWPISKRPNLDVFLNSFVERMVWHPTSNSEATKRTASGVVFVDRNRTLGTILANHEDILSAGSLRSPLILEQSSILKKHDIDVVVDLPFVGENLQAQTTTDMFYISNNSTNATGASGYAAYFSADDVFWEGLDALNATVAASIKQYAEMTADTSGVVDRSISERFFRAQYDLIFKKKLSISEIIVTPSSTGSVTIEYWGLLPFSRGSIYINSANASVPGVINLNYYMLDYDIHQQIGKARMARKFANKAPFSKSILNEIIPGLSKVPSDASNSDWEKWPKSTSAMLPQDLGGVVDSNLTVYGTNNVRVVDASVVPFQVCGHLTSTLYAIAEKAADTIKVHNK